MIDFFFLCNRRKLITFCGIGIEIEFDINGVDVKEGFRLYEDGFFKNKIIKTKHPRMLESVIIGKKGWGLWLQEWTSGISECSFTKSEILDEFSKVGIIIPEPLLKDFNNVLDKKRLKKYESICNV